MVEDAAEEFQKVQDICHARVMCQTLERLSREGEEAKREENKQRAFKPVPTAISTA